MRLERHLASIKILKFDNNNNNKRERHGVLLPENIESLVVGSSGCGKTSFLLSLILDPAGLRFENVYIFSKLLYQPKYQYLKDIFKVLKNIVLIRQPL